MTESQQEHTKTQDDMSVNSGFIPISFWRLAGKELRETLRDRRTLITLFLMPIIVYPILSLLFQGFIASGFDSPNDQAVTNSQPADTNEFIFAFNDEDSFNVLLPHLNRGFQNRIIAKRANAENQLDQPANDQPLPHLLKQHQFFVADESDVSLPRMIGRGLADVGVHISEIETRNGTMKPVRFKLYYVDSDPRSIEALRLFEQILDSITIGSYRDVIIANGIRGIAAPLSFETESVSATTTKKAGISFAALIPLILTLMTITGAVYPAIDLTAGERERGTLESMIAAPIPRMRILLGKLVAIVAVAMLTAIVNLVGMTITLWVFQFDQALFGEQGLTLFTAARILGLLLLFAVFFSSLLLVITSFARSFKEGQAYLIPLMMVALAPSLMSLKPDLELAGLWTVTPLVNIVLLARDVLSGTASWSNGVVTVGTTILYSILAVTMAARFFGTAKVLYGMDQGIGTLIRRPKQSRKTASASLAMLCLALLFPASFLWQGVMARTASTSDNTASGEASSLVTENLVQYQLWMAALGLALVFLVIPVCLAVFHKIKLNSGLGMIKASALAIVAGIAMGVGFGPLLLQGIAWSANLLEQIGISDEAVSQALVQRGEQHIAQLKSAPLWLVLFAMAVVPAICEELFFRGLLFRAFLPNMKPWQAILGTAILFGTFHLISASGLTLSRLLPTTIMGGVLGWVCYRSGSVIPCILMHAIHNSITVCFAYFRDDLVDKGWIESQQSSVPVAVLALGLVCAGIGVLILMFQKPPIERVADYLPVADL